MRLKHDLSADNHVTALFGLLLGLLFLFAACQAYAHDTATAAIEKARPSVVAVYPQWQGRPPNAEEPEGSGVVMGDGTLILTATHVLANAQDILIGTHDGRRLRATRVADDVSTDLSLLKIEKPLQAIELNPDPQPGALACAMGNAFGLGITSTCGTVSALEQSDVGFNPVEDFIQTDAAVNPGASGGALIDGEGRLIGVLSAIFTKTSDANIGVNFAASVPLALAATESLKEGVAPVWPRLGARLAPHPPAGEEGPVGARILAMAPGGIAESAGLKVDDVLVNIMGRRIDGRGDVTAALALATRGEDLSFVILRNGKSETLSVRLPSE